MKKLLLVVYFAPMIMQAATHHEVWNENRAIYLPRLPQLCQRLRAFDLSQVADCIYITQLADQAVTIHEIAEAIDCIVLFEPTLERRKADIARVLMVNASNVALQEYQRRFGGNSNN